MKQKPTMKTWERRLIIVKDHELLVYNPEDDPATAKPRGSSLTREKNNGCDLKVYKAAPVPRPKICLLDSYYRFVTLSYKVMRSHPPVTKEFHFAMMRAEMDKFISVINNIN